jgi:ankyrin repeat protein
MNGASIYDRDLNEQTPLHHACDWNREEITKLLLQKGADINTKDITMLTPFLIAAGWGRMEVMDILLTMRADTLATDEQDNTVLHICAATGQTAIMRLVMDKFPDEMQSILIARNKYGWTPLDFAMKCGHLGVTKILVRAILKNDTPRPNRMTFVHTRFNVVKLVDLNRDEMHLQRFVDLDSDKECFQVPRCKWYIHAGSKEEYDKVTLFVSKYEDRLKLRGAKT